MSLNENMGRVFDIDTHPQEDWRGAGQRERPDAGNIGHEEQARRASR
eukprot:COSAG03_NODE_12_length_22635_cov_7.308307_15_plen_47_part_00